VHRRDGARNGAIGGQRSRGQRALRPLAGGAGERSRGADGIVAVVADPTGTGSAAGAVTVGPGDAS
jgi:hypothetical protein